ncbi:MAG: hypothetical protein M3R09_09960 [Actinomycetota bacterium]|nr:hypothetical protein [Actinomycetota bacterium]
MDAGYDAELWGDFAVALAGAAAALAGLLVVAVSINVREILADRHLPLRAATALIALTTPLIIALLVLVPGQSDTVLGLALLAVGVVAATSLALINSPFRLPPQRTLGMWALGTALPVALLVVPTVLAGLGVMLGALGGLYWLPVAAVAALVGGLLQAWVLLIEILR